MDPTKRKNRAVRLVDGSENGDFPSAVASATQAATGLAGRLRAPCRADIALRIVNTVVLCSYTPNGLN